MSTTNIEPNNKNYLSPLGFRFQLSRTPKTNYFVQAVTLPSITLGQIDFDTPFVKMPLPGTKLDFQQLTLSFAVNEDMENYLEIYEWMQALGFPKSFNQYASIANDTQGGSGKANSIYSDGTLLVMTSNHNVNLRVKFEEMYPVSLSDLSFDSTMTDVDYLKATVTFAYKLYTIEKA